MARGDPYACPVPENNNRRASPGATERPSKDREHGRVSNAVGRVEKVVKWHTDADLGSHGEDRAPDGDGPKALTRDAAPARPAVNRLRGGHRGQAPVVSVSDRQESQRLNQHDGPPRRSGWRPSLIVASVLFVAGYAWFLIAVHERVS